MLSRPPSTILFATLFPSQPLFRSCFSFREVIQMARHVTGHPIPLVVAGRREGDPPRLVADAMLARKELEWRPAHADLEKIVRDAWSWELRHAEWRRD